MLQTFIIIIIIHHIRRIVVYAVRVIERRWTFGQTCAGQTSRETQFNFSTATS